MSANKHKHTPGPWRVAGRRTFGPSTGARDITHTVVAMPHPNGEWEVIGVRSANEEADARLIAAAPDMLEALEAMLAMYESAPEYPTMAEIDEMLAVDEKARAAIKKARGEK